MGAYTDLNYKVFEHKSNSKSEQKNLTIKPTTVNDGWLGFMAYQPL